jgi:hypothetical protein
MFERFVAGMGGARRCNRDDPRSADNFIPVMTENLAQPSANTIARNRGADFARRDEAGACFVANISSEHGKRQNVTARHCALLAHTLKFCRMCKPARSWKAKVAQHANMLR